MIQKKDEVIQLCQELIRKRSYSGQEDNVAQVLATYFKNNSFDSIETDCYGNVVGCIRGNTEGPKILFDGHMDTVEVTDERTWTYPPFDAQIHYEKIYGRGTSDMKGALAAMAVAAADYAQKTERNFSGTIYIAGVVHEECFEGVAARMVSKMVQPDIVVIGEASQCNLKIGQRGRAEIKLEVYGKHSI